MLGIIDSNLSFYIYPNTTYIQIHLFIPELRWHLYHKSKILYQIGSISGFFSSVPLVWLSFHAAPFKIFQFIKYLIFERLSLSYCFSFFNIFIILIFLFKNICLPCDYSSYCDFQDYCVVFLIQVLDTFIKFTSKCFLIFFICFCNLVFICHLLFAIILLFIWRLLTFVYWFYYLTLLNFLIIVVLQLNILNFSDVQSCINRYGFNSAFQILMLLFIFSHLLCLISLLQS